MKKSILILFLIVVFASVVFLILKKTKIKNIECKNQSSNCSNLIYEKVNHYKGLDVVSSKRLIERTLSGLGQVSKFSVQFMFPDKIYVNLTEKNAVFAINYIKSKSFALIDNDHRVFLFSDSVSVPVLYIDSSDYFQGFKPNIDTRLPDEIIFGGEILLDMNKNIKINYLKTFDGGFEAQIDSDIKVLFPSDGDRNYLIGALALILSRLNNIEQKTRIETVIDLRFKNPVLR